MKMMIRKNAVVIDKSRDSLFDELGLIRLRDSYMQPNEKSPQDRFSYVARKFATNTAHAQRIYDYASKHWLSFATPILSANGSKRSLPISCFLSYIPDTAEGLVDTMGEVAYLSMAGGGVGLGIGIRAEDDKSTGVMAHMKTYEAIQLAYRQGKTRRGSFAGYLDISHPNIKMFIDMRKPTGDANLRCLELHHGVNISDEFMELVEACMLDENKDDSWPLIDPHSKEVREVVSARHLWESMIETRMRTGEPFFHFIDASNRAMPWYQREAGLKVVQSNICTEITLPTNVDRTAVCCLSSFNLEYWDEWKDNYQFYRDVAEFLDNVLTYFIRKAPKAIKRAVYSASRERAIGIGALGFHALLQKKNVPFESALATSLNHQIFSRYKTNLDRASVELAEERGPCPDAADYGVMERFSCKSSIAPNASSSIVMGNTSASVEPRRGNAYRQDTMSGAFIHRNPYLDEILKDRCRGDTYNDTWNGIISAGGSVQHLTHLLTSHELDVFKTFAEIDQRWVVQHAADRQQYLDQAQSINFAFTADVTIDYLHHVHFLSWKLGLKTNYYCRSEKIYRGMNTRAAIQDTVQFDRSVDEGCLACEG